MSFAGTVMVAASGGTQVPEDTGKAGHCTCFFRKSLLPGSCLLVGGVAWKPSEPVPSPGQINFPLRHHGTCSSLSKGQSYSHTDLFINCEAWSLCLFWDYKYKPDAFVQKVKFLLWGVWSSADCKLKIWGETGKDSETTEDLERRLDVFVHWIHKNESVSW